MAYHTTANVEVEPDGHGYAVYSDGQVVGGIAKVVGDDESWLAYSGQSDDWILITPSLTKAFCIGPNKPDINHVKRVEAALRKAVSLMAKRRSDQ